MVPVRLDFAVFPGGGLLFDATMRREEEGMFLWIVRLVLAAGALLLANGAVQLKADLDAERGYSLLLRADVVAAEARLDAEALRVQRLLVELDQARAELASCDGAPGGDFL